MSFEAGLFETPLDPKILLALEIARHEAGARGHDMVTVELVALALLSDPDVAHLAECVGVRLEVTERVLEETLSAPRPFAMRPRDGSMSHLVEHAIRASTASLGGGDGIRFLAALFEQSSAARALAEEAGASPTKLRAIASLAPTTEAMTGSPYRSSRVPAQWTLQLRAVADTPPDQLEAILEPLALSPLGATRAGLGAQSPDGVEVGLYTEHDAQRLARTVEERATTAGVSLRVEARRCTSASTMLAGRARVARWWRAVRGLQALAALCLIAALALATWQVLGARQERVLTVDEALQARPERHLRLQEPTMTGSPRFLLPEAPLFMADPRRPQELYNAFDDKMYAARDKRVVFGSLPEPLASFEADRDIPTAEGTRTTRSRWMIVTCPNCTGDVLIVGPPTAMGPVGVSQRVAATVRGPGDVGRTAHEVEELYRAHGGTRRIHYVLDLEPLPSGPVQQLLPICRDDGVVDSACTPVIWAIAADDVGDALSATTVLEGWLTVSEDPRLRASTHDPPHDPARVLRIGAAPPAPPRSLREVGLVVGLGLLGVSLGSGARLLRKRWRPTRVP